MRGNPNDNFTDRNAAGWVKGDETVVVYLPTDSEEAAINVGLVLRDLLHAEDVDISIADEQSIVTVQSRYTTSVEKVGEAISNVTGHYRIEGAVWLSGAPRLVHSLAAVD